MKSFRYALLGSAAALLVTLGVVSPAAADDDYNRVRIIGQVTEVNPATGTLSLQSSGNVTTVAVTPFTDIELETQAGPFDYDRHIPLSEVKVGDWAKVKARPNGQGGLAADDIDIRR